mgnify:CR=1 FL=1
MGQPLTGGTRREFSGDHSHHTPADRPPQSTISRHPPRNRRYSLCHSERTSAPGPYGMIPPACTRRPRSSQTLVIKKKKKESFEPFLPSIFPDHQSGYINGRSTHHGAFRFSHPDLDHIRLLLSSLTARKPMIGSQIEWHVTLCLYPRPLKSSPRLQTTNLKVISD